MKKIICMLLTITIVFSATACSSNKSNDSKKEKSKNEEVKKEFIQSIDRLLQENAENKEELLSIVQGYSLYDSAAKS